MADNPNRGSARSNSQGSGAPRRSGAPSNPRLMDFIDGERIQFRNPNVPARFNGRNRSDRSQNGPNNNRNRYEKQPSAGNRNRYERPSNGRNRSDRYSSEGNYSGRLFYSSNYEAMNGGDRPKPASETDNLNEDSGFVVVDTDRIDRLHSDINCVDQGTTSSAKCNNNLDELPNWNLDEESEGSCNRCQWDLTPHVHLARPVQIASNSNQAPEPLQGSSEMESARNNQNYGLGSGDFERGNAIRNMDRDDYDVDLERYTLPSSFESTRRGRGRGRFNPRPRWVPRFIQEEQEANRLEQERLSAELEGTIHRDSNAGDNPSNSSETAISQNSNSRPIRGRMYSEESASNQPRAITKRNTSNTEDVTDLPHTITSGALDDQWVNAPEFYPKSSKPKSYAEAVNPKTGLPLIDGADKIMCPLIERAGVCKMVPHCPYMHGDLCELCGAPALHPTDQEQRKQHHKKCLEHHEKEMELSFAIARSKEKTCGICFEVVVEKEAHERRFGILTKCNHCFCLSCIRKWRQARQFENRVVRACPECRVTSDFVCPSLYWVETKEEKDQLIANYKTALAEKECKYFKQGRGSCPFGNKCFYLHALPDGTKTDVGPPPRRRRHRNRRRDERELGDMLQQIILWDFLDEQDHHWLYSFADDLEDLVAFFSDSDDSEWSEYEYLLD